MLAFGRFEHAGHIEDVLVLARTMMAPSGMGDQTSRVPGLAPRSAGISAGTVAWPFAVKVDSAMAMALTFGFTAMRSRSTKLGN